ncbi:MAG: DVU0259 family response regulator domain-containing protein [Desulfosudaceae bacterium]
MKKILIVDDDSSVRDYLSSIFEDNGYRTVTAADAPGALAVAQEELPDLITLDLELPGEWGPRFYRHLSQQPDLQNIPVIVVSGLSGNKYAIGKAVASLTKPFDREELLDIVRENIGPGD